MLENVVPSIKHSSAETVNDSAKKGDVDVVQSMTILDKYVMDRVIVPYLLIKTIKTTTDVFIKIKNG